MVGPELSKMNSEVNIKVGQHSSARFGTATIDTYFMFVSHSILDAVCSVVQMGAHPNLFINNFASR